METPPSRLDLTTANNADNLPDAVPSKPEPDDAGFGRAIGRRPPSRIGSIWAAPIHPLSALARGAGLFTLEGASVGLFVWELRAGDALMPYLRSNKMEPEARHVLLSHMGLGIVVFLLLGLGYFLWRRSTAPIELYRASMRLAPLSVVAFLPMLFNWKLWEGSDLTYLALVSLVALGAQRAAYQCFAAGPVAGVSATIVARAFRNLGQRVGRALRSVSRWLPILIVASFAVWYVAFFRTTPSKTTAAYEPHLLTLVLRTTSYGTPFTEVGYLRPLRYVGRIARS